MNTTSVQPTLKNPLNQSLFQVTGFPYLEPQQISKAELQLIGYEHFFIVTYLLHSDFVLKPFFMFHERDEANVHEVSYDLLNPDLTVALKFELQELTLRNTRMVTDASSPAGIQIEFTYHVGQVL